MAVSFVMVRCVQVCLCTQLTFPGAYLLDSLLSPWQLQQHPGPRRDGVPDKANLTRRWAFI